MRLRELPLLSLLLLVVGISTTSTTLAQPSTAVLTVVQGVPSVVVDVCLDEGSTGSFTKIASNLSFKQMVSKELPMGTHALRFVGVGTVCAAPLPGLSTTVSLLPGMNVTVVGGLNSSGTANTTTSFVNDVTPMTFGRELVVRHVAAAPTLDFRYGPILPRTRIEDLAFGADVTRSVLFAFLRVDATLANQSNPVVGPNPILLDSRSSTIVYILGSTAGGTGDFAIQRIDRRVGLSPFNFTTSFEPEAQPDPAPTMDVVSMAQLLAFGPFVAVEVRVTNTTGIYGAEFSLVYPPESMVFLGLSPGSLLEQGGAPVSYSASNSGAGRLNVTATRVGAVGEASASGTAPLIRLVFAVPQEGTSPVTFEDEALLDDTAMELPGVVWFGGTMKAE